MTDILTINFNHHESVDNDIPGVCVIRHHKDGKKEIFNVVVGDEAKYIYNAVNAVIGKGKPTKDPAYYNSIPSNIKGIFKHNEIQDATEEECKSVNDYVKSVSNEVDLNYEEFVMFLKAIMTDYDFENFVTLYRDFKENGGELNGWFFDKEE